jgi:hypothetical protein
MSSQVDPIRVLEEVTLAAPLGVRFWDVAAAAPAELGLKVTACPVAIPEWRSTAIPNGRGVYSFAGLPGLRAFENGAGNDALWAANPPAISFNLQVEDPRQRYLPFRFTALLPVRGIYGLFSSPVFTTLTPDATWIPLFSTSSRPARGPSAIIHANLAELKSDSSTVPGAWAMVTAQFLGSPLAAGLADGNGIVTLPVPYPEPLMTSQITSPLGVGRGKFTDQKWPVTISVFYTPGLDKQSLCDLEVLLSQPAAHAWRDTNHSTPAGDFTVQYGKDLVLRSLVAASGRELPVLLITPAGSPL